MLMNQFIKKLFLMASIGLILTGAISSNISLHGSQEVTTAIKTSQEMPTEEHSKITHLLNEHAKDILKTFCTGSKPHHAEFSWLPGYLVKTEGSRLEPDHIQKKIASRIDGANALLHCIRKNNLTFVTVPEKWLYIMLERLLLETCPSLLRLYPHVSRYVIAKKFEFIENKTISLEQARDICFLLKNARFDNPEGGYYYYNDVKPANLVQCIDGKIGFIDTELRGFTSTSPLEGITQFLKFPLLDEQSKEFIQQELIKIEQENEK